MERAKTGDWWEPKQFFLAGEKDDRKPANKEHWHPDRTINAKVIRCLATGEIWPGETAPWPVHARGIRISLARTSGDLDLEDATATRPVWFDNCAFDNEVVLRRARVMTLNFNGCHLPSMSANAMRVDGSLFLRNGFEAHGEVNLVCATIEGNFECNGAKFLNEAKTALNANGAKITGGVYLRGGFEAHGEVNLVAATIGGSFDCQVGKFLNEAKTALNANGAKITGGVYLRGGFEAQGEVNLVGTTIEGSLDCSDGKFLNEGKTALNANGAKIAGGVFLCAGFEAHGEVNLVGATIEGNFECDGGKFLNEGKMALSAGGAKITGGVYLRDGFEAQGEVNLVNAMIGSQFQCCGGSFIHSTGTALTLRFAEIASALRFEGRLLDTVCWLPALFRGQVDLMQAKCVTFCDDKVDWSTCSGLLLDGFTYERFHECDTNWKIRRDWLLRQSPTHLGFDPKLPVAPVWRRILRSISQAANLIAHREQSPPQSQPPNGTFRPQPWTQAVKVLRAMGHDDDARELAMQREIMRANSASTRWHLRAWLHLLRWTIGNGYKPQWALYWSLLFVVLGWLTFATAANLGFMAPRDGSVQVLLASEAKAKIPEHYTRFNGPIFALDVYLPIIELGQDTAWEPTDTQTGHRRATADSRWVEFVRLVLGHDWSVTGQKSANEHKHPLPPQTIWDRGAAFAAWCFSLGVHRFIYWAVELLGWLFVSLYIAGMSGIMKNE